LIARMEEEERRGEGERREEEQAYSDDFSSDEEEEKAKDENGNEVDEESDLEPDSLAEEEEEEDVSTPVAEQMPSLDEVFKEKMTVTDRPESSYSRQSVSYFVDWEEEEKLPQTPKMSQSMIMAPRPPSRDSSVSFFVDVSSVEATPVKVSNEKAAAKASKATPVKTGVAGRRWSGSSRGNNGLDAFFLAVREVLDKLASASHSKAEVRAKASTGQRLIELMRGGRGQAAQGQQVDLAGEVRPDGGGQGDLAR